MSDFELGRKAERLLVEQELFPLIDCLRETGRKLTEELAIAKENARIERDVLKKQIELLAEQMDPDKQCPPDNVGPFGPCPDDITCSVCWMQWSRKKAESILNETH